ncbi:MAG: hypothetical protein ABIU09_07885 [Pyrinomonadaceae bacterium]
MKKYRRIEITAFRRRVMIVSGDPIAETGGVDVSVNDTDSLETIETGSDEGQEILLEAIRLLEGTVSKQPRLKCILPHLMTTSYALNKELKL